MTDRSKLKLHPGSEWSADSVVDRHGLLVAVGGGTENRHIYFNDGKVTVGAYITDALAVIRAAGLDPEFEELEEARAEIARLTLNAQMDAQIVQAVRETCHDFEDRLEAANALIDSMAQELDHIRQCK